MNGKQRFYCKNCQRSFSKRNQSVKFSNEFIWFRKWLIEKYTFKQLADNSRNSSAKLRRVISHNLNARPIRTKIDLTGIKYLEFDGTFIVRRIITAAILMDVESGALIEGKYNLRESRKKDLDVFFVNLKENGLNPKSCTVDGNPTVISSLINAWPNIIIQRCLVHIQRQGLMWCRIKPKTTVGRKLRKIFLKVVKIKTIQDRNAFIRIVCLWEKKYGFKIGKSSDRGWVTSDLKRARSMLLKALANSFHYLNNHRIPPTTNMAESYFNEMKSCYRRHCGLSPKSRQSFFEWYFELKR